MKSTLKKIAHFSIALLMVSCEDVIEVNLPNLPPKLVIEASLNWFKGTTGNFQKIQLTLSAPYFDTEVPPATNAQVSVTDSNNNTFVFTENQNTGVYITTDFIPKLNEEYTLHIVYQNETYTGKEVLKPVTPITRVEQENNKGFSGDETELKAYYSDPENEKNFYFFEFVNNRLSMVDLEIYNDEFTNGNEIFGYYSRDDLNTGDEIIIKNYGVSERFYQYLFLLLQQKPDATGSPFETQPASIRGNCINVTNKDNYPLGYFRVSEAHQFVYTIQ